LHYLNAIKYTHLTVFSRTTLVSQQQKGQPFWLLIKQEMMGGISWSVCKLFAPRFRQTTCYHSITAGWLLCLMLNQQFQTTEGKATDVELLIP